MGDLKPRRVRQYLQMLAVMIPSPPDPSPGSAELSWPVSAWSVRDRLKHSFVSSMGFSGCLSDASTGNPDCVLAGQVLPTTPLLFSAGLFQGSRQEQGHDSEVVKPFRAAPIRPEAHRA